MCLRWRAGNIDCEGEVGDVGQQKEPGAPATDLRKPGKITSGCAAAAAMETDIAVDNRIVDKGKLELHGNLAPSREVHRGESSRRKGKRTPSLSPDPPEVHSSDSDFQSTPEVVDRPIIVMTTQIGALV